MKRIICVAVSALVLLISLALNAAAVTISYTDTTYAPANGGNEILYTLTLTGSGLDWTGNFTISNTVDVGPPEYFADWATFKFVAGQVSTISGLTAPVGTWSVANSSVSAYKGGEITADSDVKETDFNELLAGNSTGFYVSNLEKPSPFSNSGLGGSSGIIATAIQSGVPVTGAANTQYMFSFSLTLPSGYSLSSDIPFQVGYFDIEAYGNANSRLKVIQGQLSEALVPPIEPPPGPPSIPEPGTLILLGSGLVIAAAWIKTRKNS
jgi:hypothetical protein